MCENPDQLHGWDVTISPGWDITINPDTAVRTQQENIDQECEEELPETD